MRINVEIKVCHIFRTGRPTNFLIGTQMKHDDPYHRQAPRAPRLKFTSMSQSHVVRLTGVGFVHKSRTKGPKKHHFFVKKVAHLTGNNAQVPGSRSKGQRLMSPGRSLPKPKVCHLQLGSALQPPCLVKLGWAEAYNKYKTFVTYRFPLNFSACNFEFSPARL